MSKKNGMRILVSFLAFDDVRADLYAFPFTFLTCCQVYFDI